MLRPPGDASFGRPEGGWRLAARAPHPRPRVGHAGQPELHLAVIGVVLASVAVVAIDGLQPLALHHGALPDALEWSFTIVYTTG